MSEIATMTASEAPVLIVGAGPTGLVAAIELARRGVPVHLVDRLPQPSPWSAAIFIKSRTLEILADLDLVDRFLEHATVAGQARKLFGPCLRQAWGLEHCGNACGRRVTKLYSGGGIAIS